MISVIVYGRNDSHGYNLHKRAAISFNCIAEVLTHKDDEIIFVDCNTPDDMPTFPEAIADTVIKLLRDDSERERIGRAARTFVEAKWTWEANFEKLEGVLFETARSRDVHN